MVWQPADQDSKRRARNWDPFSLGMATSNNAGVPNVDVHVTRQDTPLYLLARMPTRIVLLCGLPASGKSTLGTYIAEHIPRTKLIEYDQLSHDDASIEAWRCARRHAVDLLERSIQQFDLIVLDDNFYLRSMRKDIARALKDHSCVHFGVIHLQTDLSACLERNRNRSRSVPEHIVRSMADRMEPPFNDSPYYWDVNVLSLDTTNGDFPHDHWDTIQNFLQTKLGPIPYPSEEELTKEPTELTLSQQRDAHWRAVVRNIGQSYPHLARHANQARKHCLQSNGSTLEDFLQFEDWIPEDVLPIIREQLQALGDPPMKEER